MYASFLLSFVLTFLAVHVEQAATVYAPLEVGNVAYTFLPLGIPAAGPGRCSALCFLGYVVTTLAAFGALARQAGLRALGPALAVAFSQALWFVVPIVLRGSELGESIAPLASGNGEYVFVWISFAHSLQYLWITAAYAKRTSEYPGGLRYYGRSLIAGSAIWGLPIVLFLPSALGTHAFDAGLYALVAASVNLHHFVLDGAVWKLRDGRIARALLGSGGEHGSVETRRSLRWLGVAFLVFGGGYALVNLAAMLETGWSVPRAFERGDRARLETAARRLHWIGRDSKDTYLQIANLASSAGDIAGARAAVSRSLEITPSAIGYVNLGIFDAGAGPSRLRAGRLRARARARAGHAGGDVSPRAAPVAPRQPAGGAASARGGGAARAPERADIRASLGEGAGAGGARRPRDAGRRAPGVAPSPSGRAPVRHDRERRALAAGCVGSWSSAAPPGVCSTSRAPASSSTASGPSCSGTTR